ncbi:toxin-antitoxin system HicB family antitoxin [Glaciibacter superstes]|uniref:toxin-antitoxin system HicB family antitoxin n=1 Tax=Glaciibacter superstes TaxID=501023 RepID=UPI0003B3BF31|nr:toxin-antitoxin system HicB family antitoxin [Glaciibacter superstes]
MKQLLVRVPEEVHARLTEQAKRAGVSVNSWVNQLFELGLDPANVTRRQRLILRLMETGVVGLASARTPSGAREVPEGATRSSAAPKNAAERDALLAKARAGFTAAGGVPDAVLDDALGRNRSW